MFVKNSHLGVTVCAPKMFASRCLSLLLLLPTSESLRLPLQFLSRRSALLLVTAPPLAANAAGAKVADKIGSDGRLILNDPDAASIDVLKSPAKITSRCYLDVGVGGVPAGRIVVDLYGEIAPKTAVALSVRQDYLSHQTAC